MDKISSIQECINLCNLLLNDIEKKRNTYDQFMRGELLDAYIEASFAAESKLKSIQATLFELLKNQQV